MDLTWTLIVFAVVMILIWRFLGSYLAAVYEGRVRYLSFIEGPIYRLVGVDPEVEQSWQRYSMSLIVYSSVAILVVYGMLRLQGSLPLNPQHLGAVGPALSWNTAVSFLTNTNWQNYSGESTMSYLSQMGALAVQNFVSASVGVAVAIALVRGFARRGSVTIGNFWVDLIRGVLYVLLPIALVAAVIFIGQGAIQTLGGPVTIHDTLNHVTRTRVFTQTIPRGPFASQEAIKELGTNGGGTYNGNGATPFENPTAFTNFLSIVLLLAIPFALTYTFGKMVGNFRQGVAVVAAMVILFGAWVAMGEIAEHGTNPAVARAGLTYQPGGNVEGKEVRFGVSDSIFYNIASTQTSTGSVDSANDSLTPIGGFAVLTGMMLGEISPGGTGSGLYTILLFAIITVFIGGLMVGRTPEFLGKKIQSKEVKLAALGVLIMPIVVLIFTGIAVAVHAGRIGPTINYGPHAFTEILYAFTSMANNNGSAFASLNGNTPFYNVAGGIVMLLGRFAIMIPTLALAGVLAAKQAVPTSVGTFKTDTPMFTGLLLGVILIVGALTFFPAVSLGPVVEQLLSRRFF